MFNAIHVTHEVVYQSGGIGTVLAGLINSRPYRDGVARTVLIGPLLHPENPARFGPGGVTEYSSLDHVYDGPHARALQPVENDFNIRIAYGRRPLEDGPSARRTICEALLIDLRGINQSRVNALKRTLWERYGLRSDAYEHIWEYEQWVQLAAPAVAALEALRLATDEAPAVVFAHEYMGVATALALQTARPRRYRTLFYAHEVAPVRRIVERQPGHDVMFYPALAAARANDLYLEQVFGPQHDYFKHALVECARHCDGILAVGPRVVDELRFISPEFERADIALAYNGIPSRAVTLEERQTGREHVRQYCENLLGWRPDFIFTHVTRMAHSKALWRDIDVMTALEPHLRTRAQTAVLLVLSSELPQRPGADILRMEQEWDWPLAHRAGGIDLTSAEARYYEWVQSFNPRSRNVKIVYLNQFGFDRESCGTRVPAGAEFADLRRASDAEFGLSLYEPFGLSPLAPLTFGGLCAVSTSCGCAGFVRQVVGTKRPANVILADYIGNLRKPRPLPDALAIGAAERREIETRVAEQIAEQLLKRLPTNEEEERRLLRVGADLAKQMSWDAVAERFVFPAVRRACSRRRLLHVA